jgi:hypothetical protein
MSREEQLVSLLCEVLESPVHTINARGIYDEPHTHLSDDLVKRIAEAVSR